MRAPINLIESFKRLYDDKELTKEQMRQRVIKGTITEKEYEYIVCEKYNQKGETNA